MPDAVDVDVLVVGDGLAAWACVREVARRGRSLALVPAAPPGLPSALGRCHRPVGPRPSYVEAVAQYGREGARTLWETFREDGDAVGRLASELGLPSAVGRGGGFVLARTREEALDLAEGEDLLREDAFSGEFLDHYLLEARFDVRGVAAGYWAVNDLTVDELALVNALREEHRAVHVGVGPPLSVDLGSRVTVETARARLRADCVILAIKDPRAVPGLPSSAAFHDAPWVSAEIALSEAVVLPCPARSWDGRTRWQRTAAGLRALAAGAEDFGPVDWVAAETQAPSRSGHGSTAASRDGLPVIGAAAGLPVFLLHGGSGLDSACAVAGARWVAEAALDARDECPALLRAGRFDR